MLKRTKSSHKIQWIRKTAIKIGWWRSTFDVSKIDSDNGETAIKSANEQTKDMQFGDYYIMEILNIIEEKVKVFKLGILNMNWFNGLWIINKSKITPKLLVSNFVVHLWKIRPIWTKSMLTQVALPLTCRPLAVGGCPALVCVDPSRRGSHLRHATTDRQGAGGDKIIRL